MTTADEFERHRRHLRALAYRMLGSRADAEDIVQECWLRWQRAPREDLLSPRAWLTRVATRLCLDRLESAAARREHYVGMWLPEPLLGEQLADYDAGPEAGLAATQEVSMAFMLALERLRPLERAAFLLHEVFDLRHDEVGRHLGRSAAACRQLVHRAREHLRAARARVEVDHDELQDLWQAFAHALATGDIEAFAQALEPDAVLYSDGGGKVHAIPDALHGGHRIAQALIGFARKWDVRQQPARPALVNGEHGVVFADGAGGVSQVMAWQLARGDDRRLRVAGIFIVRNPDKLAQLRDPGPPAPMC